MKEDYFQVIFKSGDDLTKFSKPFAIVTACNPMDLELTELENKKRNEKFKSELDGIGCIYGSITGSSPDHSHQEPSYVIKISLNKALHLGKKFEQRAIFWVTGENLQIIDCNTRQKYELGSFEKRIRNLLPDDLNE